MYFLGLIPDVYISYLILLSTSWQLKKDLVMPIIDFAFLYPLLDFGVFIKLGSDDRAKIFEGSCKVDTNINVED